MDSQRAADAVEQAKDDLVRTAVARQYSKDPDLWEPYGDPGYRKSLRDSAYHFAYLGEALRSGRVELFEDYVSWVSVLFRGLGFPPEVPEKTLRCMKAAVEEVLEETAGSQTLEYIDRGLARLAVAEPDTGSYIAEDSKIGGTAARYLAELLRSDSRGAEAVISKAIEEGADIREIYLNVLQPCQREIGRLWQMGSLSVAGEHYCTAVTQRIISRLYPKLFSLSGGRVGKVCVATAVGDELHELGIRMVSDFLEMAGWDTVYLGANTPAESVVRTCIDRSADLLAISTTLTMHLAEVRDLIGRIREDGSCLSTKVMVGGYPFNLADDLWRSVGADGYAGDAAEAVRQAADLTGLPDN